MTPMARWALIATCGLLPTCSSDNVTSPPAGLASAGSSFRGGTYYAELRYFDDTCRAESVEATGPGETGPVTVPLTCSSSGEWLASVLLGSTHPSTAPVYVFTIDDGPRVFQQSAAVPCWLESLPTAIAPQGTVASPVMFEWMVLAAGTDIEYTVYTTHTPTSDLLRTSVVDDDSLTVQLAPGPYTWFVDAIAVGGHEPGSQKACSARSTGPAFTVE